MQLEGAGLGASFGDVGDLGTPEMLVLEDIGRALDVDHAQFAGIEMVAQRRPAVDALALQDQRRDHGVAVVHCLQQRWQPAVGDQRVVVQQDHGGGVDQVLHFAQPVHRRAQAEFEEAGFRASAQAVADRLDDLVWIAEVHDPELERLLRVAVHAVDALLQAGIAVARGDDDGDDGGHGCVLRDRPGGQGRQRRLPRALRA